MNLVYFHTNTIRSGWTNWAAARTLRSLGHDVLDVPIPTDCNGRVNWLAPWTPPKFEVDALVIVNGVEYLDDGLSRVYGDKWHTFKKIGLALESGARGMAFDRTNYDATFYPDSSDVFWHGDHYVLPCVDTSMFVPHSTMAETYGAASMCTMYEKRERFVKTLRHRIECGQVAAWSFGHEVHEVWTQLYVKAIQQMRVHVDLPSNNPMPTLRPFETMACGTACVTWAKLPPPLVEGVHYRRYETAAQLDAVLDELLADDVSREAMAAAGYACVRKHFNSRQRWREILATVLD